MWQIRLKHVGIEKCICILKIVYFVDYIILIKLVVL
jgi:hypothetical protein